MPLNYKGFDTLTLTFFLRRHLYSLEETNWSKKLGSDIIISLTEVKPSF